jgi:WhiB family redox-sensing transcriptional regulator
VDRELWRKDAACDGKDPVLWFPRATQDAFVSGERTRRETPKLYRDGRRICSECPVRIACLDYALRNREEHGMWGGLTASERVTLLRTRRSVPA